MCFRIFILPRVWIQDQRSCWIRHEHDKILYTTIANKTVKIASVTHLGFGSSIYHPNQHLGPWAPGVRGSSNLANSIYVEITSYIWSKFILYLIHLHLACSLAMPLRWWKPSQNYHVMHAAYANRSLDLFSWIYQNYRFQSQQMNIILALVNLVHATKNFEHHGFRSGVSHAEQKTYTTSVQRGKTIK